MMERKEAGKHLCNQYFEVCKYILLITDRAAKEYESLYDMAYGRNVDALPEKNKLKTSSVESVAIRTEKLRNDMDARYLEEIA